MLASLLGVRRKREQKLPGGGPPLWTRTSMQQAPDGGPLLFACMAQVSQFTPLPHAFCAQPCLCAPACRQSLHWSADAPATVEGGDDLAYALADGLLGHDFKYNLFGSSTAGEAAPPAAASSDRPARRLFMNEALPPATGHRLVAGSVASLK